MGALTLVRALSHSLSARSIYSLDCWELFREFSVLVGLHCQDLSECVDLVAEVLILGLELSDQGILHGISIALTIHSLDCLLRRLTRLLRRGVIVDIDEPATVHLMRLQGKKPPLLAQRAFLLQQY